MKATVMKIQFPANYDQRLYEIWYQYMLDLFKHAGIEVELKVMPEPRFECGCFPMTIDGIDFMVDYSDNGECPEADPIKTGKPCLRFHCKEKLPNVYPFPPVSFYDWAEYEQLSQSIKYECTGNKILFKQRSYGSAVERRDRIRAMLTARYDTLVDTKYDDGQVDFWKIAGDCLVSVHVPGRNNNMLDRAQLQLMGLGVCTISPRLPELLPGYLNFGAGPGLHYMQCKDDYSDLIDIAEWCKVNKEKCLEIGKHAKYLFEKTCTPQAVKGWLGTVFARVKEGVC